MSNNICLRCLSIPAAIPLGTTQAGQLGKERAFTTSSTLSALRLTVKPNRKGPLTTRKKPAVSFQLRAKPKAASVTRVDPEVARAARKRIVLSNANALEVKGLRPLDMESASQIGEIFTFSDASVDSLRAIESFKHTQGWSLFRRPSTLVTQHTAQLADIIRAISEQRSTQRELVTGRKESGKSVLALQAQALAFQKGWVVIHIPEIQDLCLSHTAYTPVRSADGQTLYSQPDYLSALLGRISKSAPILSDLVISQTHNLPIPLQPNLSLERLCNLGAADPSVAHGVFTALLQELLTPSTDVHPRPPLLFSADGIAHLTQPTAYLDPSSQKIHAMDFTLLRTFTDLLSGAIPTPNGALIMAIDSRSNRPTSPALDLAIASGQERQWKILRRLLKQQGLSPRAAGLRRPYRTDGIRSAKVADRLLFTHPYAAPDARVTATLSSGVFVRTLEGLSKSETRAVMEYYARSGILRGKVDERAVADAWSLAGGGLVGEVERGAARARVL